ncbi:MAG: molybdopterin converting factor subunit 1 [Phycisphaeraceae bacterium JB051]
MTVTIELFAVLSQAVNAQKVSLELPDSATVGQLLSLLPKSYPQLTPLLASVSVAVNMSYATAEDVLSEADQVALIPPVSGG